MNVVPLSLKEANDFVRRVHRHHKPTVGGKFALGVADSEGEVRGVAIVGRPVARHLDDGWTVEVNRVATDGADNACSMLYGACWRAARAMGYKRMVTYTLAKESGTSLRAAGWKLLGERGKHGARNWNTPSRPRIDTAELLAGQKLLWEAA